MKRVAAGAHLPIPWTLKPEKRPEDMRTTSHEWVRLLKKCESRRRVLCIPVRNVRNAMKLSVQLARNLWRWLLWIADNFKFYFARFVVHVQKNILSCSQKIGSCASGGHERMNALSAIVANSVILCESAQGLNLSNAKRSLEVQSYHALHLWLSYGWLGLIHIYQILVTMVLVEVTDQFCNCQDYGRFQSTKKLFRVREIIRIDLRGVCKLRLFPGRWIG